MKKILSCSCNRKFVIVCAVVAALMTEAVGIVADAQSAYDAQPNSAPVFRSTSSYMPQSSTKRGSYTPVGNGMMRGTSYGRTTAPLFGNTGRNTSTGFNPAGSSRLISNGTFGRNTSSFGRTTSYGNSSGVGAYVPSRSNIPGRRKINGDGSGSYEGEDDGEGHFWNGEEWIDIPVGALRANPETQESEIWNGSAWVAIGDQREPGTPVGDMPWLLLILMLGGYAVARKRILKYSKTA